MSSERTAATPCRLAIFLTLLISVAAPSCKRKPASADRLAIPAFENLGYDAADDWMGPALSEVLAGQLRTSRLVRPVRVATRADAAATGATHILHGYFYRRNGRLLVKGSVEEVASVKTSRTITATGAQLLEAANTAARQIDPDAEPYGTGNETALRALLDGRTAGDPASAAAAFERAIKADPEFGAAIVAWAQTLLSEKRYAAAAAAYRKALQREPEQPLLWNELGYAEAFARNPDGAVKALREYENRAPGDANPLDSLGDVHYYLGRFAEAERFYLQAYEKNASFGGGAPIYKAARARLMTGDVAGATEIFRRFAESRRTAGDPLAGLRQAQWSYLSGHVLEAEDQAQRFAASASNPDAGSQAYSQLSAWHLAAGDVTRAREYATRAASMARLPVSQTLSSICRFLAEPPAPAADWRKRAAGQFSGSASDAAGRYALAYALLFGRHFDDAAGVLRELNRTASPMALEQVPVLLAWALAETGRVEDAAPLVETYGIPGAGGESAFAFLSFPRIFQVRAEVLRKQGNTTEAARNLELFRKLGGRDLLPAFEPVVDMVVASGAEGFVVQTDHSQRVAKVLLKRMERLEVRRQGRNALARRGAEEFLKAAVHKERDPAAADDACLSDAGRRPWNILDDGRTAISGNRHGARSL